MTASGEPRRLLSRELLESAAAKPRNVWAYDSEADAAMLATTLLFGLARNHPFAQGNKRTAFYTTVAFLGANGIVLSLPDEVAFADSIVAVLKDLVSEETFADNLRAYVREVSE